MEDCKTVKKIYLNCLNQFILHNKTELKCHEFYLKYKKCIDN